MKTSYTEEPYSTIVYMKQTYFLNTLLALVVLLTNGCQPNSPSNINQSDSNETPTEVSSNSPNNRSNTNSQNANDIKEDYINTNRVIWQKPNVVIDFMGDISDKVVADIGAGTGYFAFRIARKAKKVIAIDIDQKFIQYLDSAKVMELTEADQARLEARFAQPDDPNLNNEEVDVIIMVNTYMYIPENIRISYLKKLLNALPKGGKILILDFKRKKTPLGPPQEDRVPLFVAELNLEEAGFSKIETNDKALDYQYLIMGTK